VYEAVPEFWKVTVDKVVVTPICDNAILYNANAVVVAALAFVVEVFKVKATFPAALVFTAKFNLV